MSQSTNKRGPLLIRVVIFFLGCLLTILLVWLLDFFLKDINKIPGAPDWQEYENKYVKQEDEDRLEALQKDLRDHGRQIARQVEIQRLLRTSKESSQATMNQLVELHRLNLQRNITPSEAEQKALAESQTLFLANEQKFQEANDQVATLSEKKRQIEAEIEAVNYRINESREPGVEEYEAAYQVHQLWIATCKLALLIPLFLFSAWLVFKKRGSAFKMFYYAMLGATSWKVGRVIHEHFPLGLFKYIAIGASILIVVVALIKLIKLITAPSLNWLLKQYREAYSQHRCPVCTEPIQRGPLKHARWTRRGPVILGVKAEETSEEDRPYTCPACGVRLFEKCPDCDGIRHALLPYCEACGAAKSITGAEAREIPAQG